mgnify:CR=1 FL=1
MGAAGADSEGLMVEGEYMPSKHIDLGSVPIAIASSVGKGGATDGDYGIKSTINYNNNRSANHQSDYFGAVGGAIGSVVAPLLDALRPSRKENTIGTHLVETGHVRRVVRKSGRDGVGVRRR